MSYDLDVILKRLAREPAVVYDSETSGLSWQRDKLIGHVFTFGPAPQDTHYVPVRHTGGGNLAPPQVKKFEAAVAKAAKVRPALHWIGHNIHFDMRFQRMVGIDVSDAAHIEDTMITAALLDEFGEVCRIDAAPAWADNRIGSSRTGSLAYLSSGRRNSAVWIEH